CSNITNNSVDLSWNANGGSKFKVERSSDGAGGPWTKATDYYISTSFTDGTLLKATTYWFRVWGYNGDNVLTTEPTNIASAITAANISPPTDFSGIAISSTIIRWTWTDNGTNETGYRIHTSTHGIIASLSANATFWIESGALPNTQYTRHSNVYNSGGDADSNSFSVYTLAQPPSDLQSTGKTSYTIDLSWSGNGATRFAIERANDNSGVPGTWVMIKSWSDNLTGTTFTDSELNHNTKYWYRIKSYNADAIINNTPSNQVSVKTTEDVTSPTAPGEITLTLPSGGDQIKPGDTTLGLSAKAEADSSLYLVIIKDQNGNELSKCIDTSGITIDANGNISGTITIGDLARNCPLTTSITIEIKVKDKAGNISTPGVSNPLKIAPATTTPQLKLYNNLFDPTQPGQKVSIRYELPEPVAVTITIHDIHGREIKKIVDNQRLPAGVQITEWSGRNIADEVVASGTYIVYIQAGSYKAKKKVLIVK
ncbi:MAG: FlgD immunoglobulin-like domain containing protein, partial [Elusimicrobiota bacterium]